MPLKNGGQIELGIGLAWASLLDGVFTQQPDHFRALLAIARGQSEGVTEKSVAYLKREHIINRDGVLIPGLSDVLLSAYEETPEGPVLTSPFHFTNEEDVRLIRRVDEESYKRLLNELKRDGGPGRAL